MLTYLCKFMKSLEYKAYAKINLGLQVLNKRTDGYHNINSIFIPISIHDIVTFEKSDSFSFFCDRNLGIDDNDNIAVKAKRIFYDLYSKSIDSEVNIKLAKSIPSGAGMGGGSSDAACVLKGLNDLFNLSIPEPELLQIAAKLGSDVPFFIRTKPAVCTGRGEIISEVCFNESLNLLVIFPNINVSTPVAYKQLGRNGDVPYYIDYQALFVNENLRLKDIQNRLKNDFEQPIFGLHPEIARIKNELYNQGADFALMSGSGSSVFGVFDCVEKAEAAKNHFSEYQTFICKSLTTK